MNISLPADAIAWMREQVAAGRYNSADDLVLAALRVLAARDSGQLEKLETLRRDVMVAIAELDAGLGEPLDIDEIEAEGRRLLDAERKRA